MHVKGQKKIQETENDVVSWKKSVADTSKHLSINVVQGNHNQKLHACIHAPVLFSEGAYDFCRH